MPPVDDKNLPGGQPDGSGGDEGDASKKTVTYESHQKLLDEKKKLSREYGDLKARIDEMEAAKLEQETDLKKQNDGLKQKLKEMSDKTVSTAKNFAKTVVRAQFDREASKLGCIDGELAYRAVDLSDIELDENYAFDPKSLSAKLQELVKEKPFLFKKDVNPPRDTDPGDDQPNGASDFSKMSSKEIMEKAKKLIS